MSRIAYFLAGLLVMATAVIRGQQPFDGPIISEFLPNPTGDLETEWIELYNPTSLTVDLNRFMIGDELGLRDISDTGLPFYPGEFLVLAADVNRFREYYADFTGRVTSPRGWQPLNNTDGEVVRLADEGGAVVDSIAYESGFPDNRSWERFIAPDGQTYWGPSFSSTGSTPGQANTYFHPRSASIELTVAPDPFSPDGDGFEDITTISFNPPEGESCELVVYDLSGRKVKSFLESGEAIPAEIEWDGAGDDGRTLPVGIYIIFARIEGAHPMETKKTVVIAR